MLERGKSTWETGFGWPEGRALEEYLGHLHMRPQDLEGKKILDIGAGVRGFARDVYEKGIHAEVISLEPLFSVPKEKRFEVFQRRVEHEEIRDTKKTTVAGVGEFLPFQSEEIDLVVSVWAMPQYASSKQQIEQFFSEISRIVKAGGEIRLYPIFSVKGLEHEKSSKISSSFRETLNEREELDDFIRAQIDKLVLSGRFVSETIPGGTEGMNTVILKKNVRGSAASLENITNAS